MTNYLSMRGCAAYALDKVLQHHEFNFNDLIVSNANRTLALESDKTTMYNWLVANGVRMPLSEEWLQTKDIISNKKYPFVLKQNTSITLGLQTVVVKSASDLATVLKSLVFTKSSSGLMQEYVVGSELTVTLLVGVNNYQLVGLAKDYKKQFDNNIGLNTSGMGSISVHEWSDEIRHQCDTIVKLFQEKYAYRGFLSCQFIIDRNNTPWLMECNNRLCSPEFQSMVVNLPSNFGECLHNALTGETIPCIDLSTKNAVTVGLLHNMWPTPQEIRHGIDLSDCPMTLTPNFGPWDYNCYWGTITNSGPQSHTELAKEIYNYLGTKDLGPYRYRNDIGL